MAEELRDVMSEEYLEDLSGRRLKTIVPVAHKNKLERKVSGS